MYGWQTPLTAEDAILVKLLLQGLSNDVVNLKLLEPHREPT